MNPATPSAPLLRDHRRVVVIPTYNEAASLPVIVGQVIRALPTDILIMDERLPRRRLVPRPGGRPGVRRPGRGLALRARRRGGELVPLRMAISRAEGSARAMLGLPVQDTTSGFKGWRADLLRAVLQGAVAAKGYVFQVEMTYRAAQHGATVREVPIVFADRALGQSKFSRRIIAEASLRIAALGLGRLLSRVRPASTARP